MDCTPHQPRKRPWLAGIALLVCAAALPGTAHAQLGGVETLSAEPLADGLWRASATYRYGREAHLYRGSDRASDPEDQRLEEHDLVLGIDYGVLPQLTASVYLPISHHELRVRDATEGTERFRTRGLGDASVLVRLRLHKTDWERSSFQVAVIGGLEMPTGDPSAREDGELLPGSVQLGSGAWNPMGALSAVLSVDRLRFDAHLFFRLNTEGRRDFTAGPEAHVEVVAAYRFLHAKYPGPAASAKLGLRWAWEGRAIQDGDRLSDSGSVVVALRPGVSFHPIPRIDLSASVDIPVYRHYRGTQLGWDVRASLAFGIRF